MPWPDAPWQEVHRLQPSSARTAHIPRARRGEVVFSNAASAIRRSVWQRQPFTLPAVEDLEWAQRVVARGWQIVYEPRTAVSPSHHETLVRRRVG